MKMKLYLVILCFMVAGCAHFAKQPEARIIGKWAFEEDLDEYSGLYVYEFTASGNIILNDYPVGWKPGDKTKRNDFGKWRMAETSHPSGERISLTFLYWKNWCDSVLTKENWLKPVSGYKRRNIRLIPITVVNGIPKGDGIEMD